MARKPKTWAEKMNAPAPHLAPLERNYGGMMTGEMMLISSPQEVASHLKAVSYTHLDVYKRQILGGRDFCF